MSSKTIEHYLANPEDMPTDLAEIEAILGQEEGGAEADTEVKEDVIEASSSPTEEVADGLEEVAPIASKDGKHTIPYAVLATEREKRVAAERMQIDLEQRLREIETKMASGQSVKAEQQEVADLLSDDDTKALLEDFPSLAPMVAYTKQLEQQVKGFQTRFEQVEQIEMQRMQVQAAQAQSDVRQAIDANPVLSFWESKDAERWSAAVEADKQLKMMPINQKLTMQERFEKVVSVVEAIYGATELPPEFAPAQKAPPKAGKVEVAPLKPRTLGEIPGGAAPKTDDLESFLDQSSVALGAKLNSMTPDQINSLLSRLG